jgi:hypothetical protein
MAVLVAPALQRWRPFLISWCPAPEPILGLCLVSVAFQETGRPMKIRAHSESHIVELDDGTKWQVFPGDLDITLHWKPETILKLVAINDDVSPQALMSEDDDGRVRVRPVGQSWPENVQSMVGKMKRGQRKTGVG